MTDQPSVSEHEAPSIALPPRKRRRPAKSCEQCRLHKIRCDRELPCGSCVRSRSSLRCSYSSTSPASSPHHDGLPTPNSIVSPYVSRTPLPTYQGDQLPGVASVLRVQVPELRTSQDTTLQELQSRVQRLESLLSDRNDISDKNLAASIAQEVSIKGISPRLRITQDKTKLYGQGHWVHTAEKFQALGKFDPKTVEPRLNDTKAELTTLFNESRKIRRRIKAQNEVKLNDPVPDLLSTIPSKVTCDELAQHYFRTFEQLYRIIHIPSFWLQYDEFWKEPTEASQPFLMQLVLILTLGATFHSDRTYLERNPHLLSTWIYAVQWWLSGPAEKRNFNIEALQVSCLLHLARYATSNGCSLFPSAGSLLNKAMSMGLHRDPDNFSALSPYQAQIRRRLWTTVVELSLQSALDSSMPILLNMDDFDVQAPSNINDQDMMQDSDNITSRPLEEYTDSSIQLKLLNSFPLRLKVARLINNIAVQPSYETALKLGAELRAACRDVATFFHSIAPRHPTDFHRRMIDMCLRRYILLLHRPFMIEAKTDPRFYLSRKVCLESAMIIASYLDKLMLPWHASDELSRLAISGTGLFRGPLSLDIITVLGLEMITQLEEETSTTQLQSSASTDPLDEMSKSNRTPVIRTLEHINEQLLQIVALGRPKMKRYIVLSAILSQIHAMETGKCVNTAVHEAAKQSVQKCLSLLQPAGTEGNGNGFEVDSFEAGDWDFDIGSLLYLPGLVETGNFGW